MVSNAAAYNTFSAYAASAAYRSAASGATGKIDAAGAYFEVAGGVSSSRSASAASDTADISTKAQEMLDRIKKLDIFSLIHPNNDATKGTKTLGEVQSDFMGDFADFSSFFGELSRMTGLSAGESFTMGLDGTGGMTVSGTDAAAAAKLQQGFSANQTMTARFAVMAARAALTDAGSTVDGFAEAYARDPVAAIENNIAALKDRLLGFRTVAGGGEMRYGFVREPGGEVDSSASVATAAYGDA